MSYPTDPCRPYPGRPRPPGPGRLARLLAVALLLVGGAS